MISSSAAFAGVFMRPLSLFLLDNPVTDVAEMP
jgi:hypothetical protein